MVRYHNLTTSDLEGFGNFVIVPEKLNYTEKDFVIINEVKDNYRAAPEGEETEGKLITGENTGVQSFFAVLGSKKQKGIGRNQVMIKLKRIANPFSKLKAADLNEGNVAANDPSNM